jgi:hypothetical protein
LVVTPPPCRASDMVLTPEGRYVFIEINPSG